VKVGAAAQRCRGLAKDSNCHLLPPPGAEGANSAEPQARMRRSRSHWPLPMRNGVGSTGRHTGDVTSAACVSPQPAIGRIVRSASFGVVSK